ncbi:MAG: transglycosylase family protein [Solirubrobacterales bacterium]
MLTKRTYIVPVLAIAIAFPAAALAATDSDGDATPRLGLADAKPAAVWSVAQPVRRFHRAIQKSVQRIRAERRRQRREVFATLPAGVSTATLEAIALCESGGDPTIVSADGSYRGKYQFSFETWASVGGSGDPAAAPEAEQDYRAALLYASAGSSPWPVCGS